MSHPGPPSVVATGVSEETPPKKGCCGKFLERVLNWLAYKDKGEWLKDMRGNLSLTVSIIATITFQSAINPPGGVVQVSDRFNHTTSGSCGEGACPGEAVLAISYEDEYLRFLLFNTLCFIASLSVCLLLVSGLYVDSTFLTWLLSIGMCITITSLALTYLYGALMVTPDEVWDTASRLLQTILWVYIGLLGLIGALLLIRFVVWGVHKCIKKKQQLSNSKEKRGDFSQWCIEFITL